MIVVTWGGSGGDSSSVASQLSSDTKIYSNYTAFAALKDDGSVVTWIKTQVALLHSYLETEIYANSNGYAFAALVRNPYYRYQI